MTHEEAVGLLPDHMQDRLDGPARSGVAQHLAGCPECRDLVDTYRTLAEGFVAESSGELPGHPSVEELVDFALGRMERLGERRDEVARHVSRCPGCSEEVETIRRGQSESEEERGAARRPGPPGPSTFRPILAAALAAGVALLLLAYPAYLGLRELPRSRGETEALRSERRADRAKQEELERSLARSEQERRRLAAWTGVVSVPLLAAPVRGSLEQEATIEVAEGQPFVCLAVDPGLPAAGGRGGIDLAEILGAGGTRVWSLPIDASEARRRISESGALVFLVPSDTLPEGRYRLRLARRGGAAERTVLEILFRVTRDR